jgi:hypothetical protein
MCVDRERQFGLPTGTLDQPIETGAIERCAALIDEDVCRSGLLLLLRPAQCPQFGAVERMCRWRAALLAGDVQRGTPEIEVFPAQFAYFRGPEAMTVGDEDHGGIPVTMSVAFGGLDQLVDFKRRLDARACGIRCSAYVRRQLLAFCPLARPGRAAILPAFVHSLD